jgi:hypothetical protein
MQMEEISSRRGMGAPRDRGGGFIEEANLPALSRRWRARDEGLLLRLLAHGNGQIQKPRKSQISFQMQGEEIARSS